MQATSLDHLPEGENIRENVKRELARNSLLKDENILVSADGDEIILQGDVDSLDKKWLAEDIAGDTFGVLHVKNEINVSNNYRDSNKESFYED
jgi:osmotically-inducible protein OsmY